VKGGGFMATSSITKQIVINDKETMERFLEIRKSDKAKSLEDSKSDQYEQGKALSKRFSFR
jgi:hypothetical protein